MQTVETIRASIAAIGEFIKATQHMDGRTRGRLSDADVETINKASEPFNAGAHHWYPSECLQHPKGKVPVFTLEPARQHIARMESLIADQAAIEAMPEYTTYQRLRHEAANARKAFEDAAKRAGVSPSRITHYL